MAWITLRSRFCEKRQKIAPDLLDFDAQRSINVSAGATQANRPTIAINAGDFARTKQPDHHGL